LHAGDDGVERAAEGVEVNLTCHPGGYLDDDPGWNVAETVCNPLYERVSRIMFASTTSDGSSRR
jgi:hypothetical protein